MSDGVEGNGKLKRKEYERELARLHVEFVKLQQWVVHAGLKVSRSASSSKGATGRARRARLNTLTHILSKVPYEKLPREKIELPRRQHRGDYKDPGYPFRVIPELF